MLDPGLDALVLLLAFHGVTVTASELRREEGVADRRFDASDLVRAGRKRGMKAAVTDIGWADLFQQTLPAVALMRSGEFTLLARVGSDEVLVHDPLRKRPIMLPRKTFEDAWSGGLVTFAPQKGQSEAAQAAAIAENRFGFAWFLPALLKQKGLLFQTLVGSLLVQGFGLVIPFFTMIVMDKVLVTGGLSTLDVMALGLLATAVFEFLIGSVRQHLFAFSTNRIDVELQTALFQHLTNLPMSYFDSRKTGAVSQRMRELEQIRAFLTGSALTSVIDLGFTVIYLGVMAFYAAWLTLVVVGTVALIALLYGLVTPKLRERLQGKSHATADGQAFLVETVAAMSTIKSMAVEPQFQRRWENMVAGHTEAAFQADRLTQITNLAVTLLNRLMTGITLWWGAYMVIVGTLSAGQLMGFNMMAGRVLAPAQRIAMLWQQFQQARLSIRRVGEILETPVEPTRPPTGAPPLLEGRIEFRSVTFRYRPDRPEILRKMTFRVEPGEVVGVVGSSGSGKSTLARLLQRLYVPESGKLLVDGVDVAGADPRWLRRQVALLPQDNTLLDLSIRENIALSDPSMDMGAVMEAAKLAGAHGFIQELPDGYDTHVGERGHLLSGGQRQRVALARALAADPRILILDEATSALDTESERLIQDNMRRICAGRTVLMIAHRLTSVRHCDRILVVEEGEVVEQGDHDALLAAHGRYAALWNGLEEPPVARGGGDA